MKTQVHYYNITKGQNAHKAIKVIEVEDSFGQIIYHVCDSRNCNAFTKDAFDALVERLGLVLP